jgi:hypothetical protein
MKPIRTDKTNLILTPPKGSESNVGNLPATKYTIKTENSELDCVMSCWELDDKELELINQTKKIYFHTYGDKHPPIMLTPYSLESMVDVETIDKE